jgi:hypothetical protein
MDFAQIQAGLLSRPAQHGTVKVPAYPPAYTFIAVLTDPPLGKKIVD